MVTWSFERNRVIYQVLPCMSKGNSSSHKTTATTSPPKETLGEVSNGSTPAKKKSYLFVVDYFSKYMEIQALPSTTSANVVTALNAIFSCHGIFTTLISDNGPQYIAEYMKIFVKGYGFQQVTSSPYYAKSNGQAVRTVRTIKHLLECSPDSYLTLMS